MKKIFGYLIVASCMASVSNLAHADSSGVYAAFDIGQHKMKEMCAAEPGVTYTSCDDSDMAYRLGIGYQLNQNFGVEASYINLSDLAASGTYLGAAFTQKVSGDAFQFAVIGTAPINESFSVFGKVGVARASLDNDANVIGVGAGKESANSTKATFGVGASYNINKQMAIRAQYEDLGKWGDDATTGTSKVNMFSVGIAYKF